MNLSSSDIITYVVVFVVIFSLFYILYAVAYTLYRGIPIFDLFRAKDYEKLDDDREESILDDYAPKLGGDRVKNLIKNPPSLFEKYVRDKIEKLTGHKFPTVYPSWLKAGKTTFELDGYNKKLGIAFETQGPQHYEFNKKYYNNYLDYYTRILHDQIKRKKCEKYGIGLIIVDHSVPKHLLTYYVGSRLWDICCEKSSIERSMTFRKGVSKGVSEVGSKVDSKGVNSAKMPYSKVNCAELAKCSGVWGNIAEKPAMYVEKINRTPYRNYELEKQMVLEGIL